MDILNNLAMGFGVAFTPINILYAFIGSLVGTLIGVLPGIGPVATIAMLLPLTYGLPTVTALIMLAGIYYGASYGGSTTAILVNLPGEMSSVITVIDGHKMARQGRAGAALCVAALGSFFAGCVATLVIAAFAPLLSDLALKFDAAEYFSLMVLGLASAIVLAHGSVLKAVLMTLLGLLFGVIGTDVNTGTARFSFNIPELVDGIGFVAMTMGLFAFAEIAVNLEGAAGQRELLSAPINRIWIT
jgi:TctA family transporter